MNTAQDLMNELTKKLVFELGEPTADIGKVVSMHSEEEVLI